MRAHPMASLPSTSGVVAAIVAATCASGCGVSADPDRPVPSEGATAQAEIAWPEAAAVDRGVRDALPVAARRAVDRSPVPALVPRRAELLASATVLAREQWYAVSARGEGFTVSIHATRMGHRYPSIQPATGDRSLRGTKAFVTRNEAIWSASWRERGASYTMDVECADPGAARCADEAFLLELVEDLAYVGGAGAAR